MKIQISVPVDGTWHKFWVSGKVASSEDKDVVINAIDEQGMNLASLPVMVRVRKDARTLTSSEKKKFLETVRAMHSANMFDKYWRAHQAAFSLDIHGLNRKPFPPLFLAWHRAFLLNFERDMQTIEPTVAMPYWKFDEPSFLPNQSETETIFSPNFLGGFDPLGSTVVAFDNGANGKKNPWFNWRTMVDRQPLRAR